MKQYVYKKQIFELIIAKDMERIKDIYIMQNVNITNDFDSSGGRVIKFTGSGHSSLLIEVRGNYYYYY